jgi:hypothetical protein
MVIQKAVDDEDEGDEEEKPKKAPARKPRSKVGQHLFSINSK